MLKTITKELLQAKLDRLTHEHIEMLRDRLNMGMSRDMFLDEDLNIEEQIACIMEDDGSNWTLEENTIFEMGMRHAYKEILSIFNS